MPGTTRWLQWLRGAALAAGVWCATEGITGADAPQHLLEGYAELAKAADPTFVGFSAERGHELYLSKHVMKGVGAISCASCHRKDPREQIRAHKVDILCRACHVINDEEHPMPKEAKLRYIEPFAPHANPERFSDSVHVEKFFKLNCMMVLKRECTPVEKGDIIAWLLTVDGEPQYPAGRATGPVRAEE
jgi:hypothetical protein